MERVHSFALGQRWYGRGSGQIYLYLYIIVIASFPPVGDNLHNAQLAMLFCNHKVDNMIERSNKHA